MEGPDRRLQAGGLLFSTHTYTHARKVGVQCVRSVLKLLILTHTHTHLTVAATLKDNIVV